MSILQISMHCQNTIHTCTRSCLDMCSSLTHSDSENSKARRMSICDETQALVGRQIPVSDLRDNSALMSISQYSPCRVKKWRSVLTKPLAYPQMSLDPSVLMSTADTAPQKPTTAEQTNYTDMKYYYTGSP